MNCLPVPLNRHQSASAKAMNSVPWSNRTKRGARRIVARRSRTETTWSASMERSTSMAKTSLVNYVMLLSPMRRASCLRHPVRRRLRNCRRGIGIGTGFGIGPRHDRKWSSNEGRFLSNSG
jgi:hypothetical protein